MSKYLFPHIFINNGSIYIHPIVFCQKEKQSKDPVFQFSFTLSHENPASMPPASFSMFLGLFLSPNCGGFGGNGG